MTSGRGELLEKHDDPQKVFINNMTTETTEGKQKNKNQFELQPELTFKDNFIHKEAIDFKKSLG